MQFEKIAFEAARHAQAREALSAMRHRYGHTPAEDADLVVALGGDGFMLESLHAALERGAPVYGMNRGSVGFLMNEFRIDGLEERLSRAEAVTMHPLRMRAQDIHGNEIEGLAVNEVSLLRQTRYAAKLKIFIDGVERMEEMICDGVLVATPAGSTAYNLSAHGAIIPLGADLLALTPISPFRPRRWRGALLPSGARVRIDIQMPETRSVSATADFTEVRDAARIDVCEDRNISVTILIDPEHSMEERVLKEQFQP